MPAWLVESAGEHAGRMHPIDPTKKVTIGRSPDNDIVVGNAQASRRHATISHDGQRWLIEDHQTKNGTLLNGTPVAAPRELAEGDEIVLPGIAATFHLTDETMAIIPTASERSSATKTFLFADLRDYTSFVEKQGDAAASEMIAEYRTLVRAQIRSADGTEIKTEGDSFFVVFDSARRAVDCAVAIVRGAEAHARQRPDRPIRVGIGVHAGEPVRQGGDYVGSAVNVAARLAQNARANEVLVTDVVRGLLRTSGLPPMTVRENVVLKGIEDPPRIFALMLEEAPAQGSA